MNYKRFIQAGTLASELLTGKKIAKPDGGVIEPNPEITDREKAMAWWNDELSFTDRGNLMEGEFKHRHPQSLTGREIETLYITEFLKTK